MGVGLWVLFAILGFLVLCILYWFLALISGRGDASFKEFIGGVLQMICFGFGNK